MASTISSLPVALPIVKASHKPSHAKPSSPKTLPAKPAALPKQITDCRKSNISYKLAFSGPAPKRINGRLAMVEFVSAIGVELVKGDGLMAQLANGGLPWFFYTTVLLSVAFWNTFETKFSPRHI